MKLPLTYNLRNLMERKGSTIMTATGIALTVAVLLAVMALVAGLEQAFSSSGNPLQVIALRKGATSELVSGVTREKYNDLRFVPGVKKDSAGNPLVSLEMITVINLPSVESPDGMNVNLRGLLPVGFEMRDGVRVMEGRMFQTGQREVVVGKSIARRYPAARLGQQLRFGKGLWNVVGIMDGGDSAVNSEIFGDLNQVSSDFNRENGLSSVLLRAENEAEASALVNRISENVRFDLDAQSEKAYYAAQTQSGAPIQIAGSVVAIIMAIGSSFAAMNTMYAAIARRSREIGTLRVLGFSRGSILLSFFIESVLLSLLGGIIGCIIVLPMNGITTGIGSFVTFSEISFNYRITPQIMLSGLAFAAALGAIGGLLPAWAASRKEILVALRDQ
jgi:putative ABC transport system permease protein